MASEQLPVEIDICRRRGDTFPFVLTISVGGTALDITGYTFLLTVDPEEEPTGSGNNLFQLTGTIVDGPSGQVQFSLTAMQADNVGEYFHDVQWTDGSGFIRTFARGAWVFTQDVTK